jgi:hypothetical protein
LLPSKRVSLLQRFVASSPEVSPAAVSSLIPHAIPDGLRPARRSKRLTLVATVDLRTPPNLRLLRPTTPLPRTPLRQTY